MPPRVVELVRDTSWSLGVNPKRVMSGEVSGDVSHARHEVMRQVRDRIVMADGLSPSYPLIGSWFGRDHTTVIYGVKASRRRKAQ